MNKRILYALLSVLFIFAIWFAGGYFVPDKVPHLGTVLKSIYNNFGIHIVNVEATVKHSLLGLLIATSVSILLIIAISIIPNIEFFTTPLAVLLKTSPVVALVPIFMIFFKSNGSILAASVAISFFPIYIAGIDGLKRTPEKLIKLAKIYNTNRWNQFRYFKSGYVLESVLSSLKIAAPLSVVGAIVGEYIMGGSNKGMGIYIVSNLGIDPQPRFVGIVLATMIGLFFYGIISFIYWYYERQLHINKQ